jgi:hypothetical protein
MCERTVIDANREFVWWGVLGAEEKNVGGQRAVVEERTKDI